MIRYLVFVLLASTALHSAAGGADLSLAEEAKAAFDDKQWEILQRLLAEQRKRLLAEVRNQRADGETTAEAPAEAPAPDSWVSIPLGRTLSPEATVRRAAADPARFFRAARTDRPGAAALRIDAPSALQGAAGVAPANRNSRGDDSTLQIDASTGTAVATINVVVPLEPRYEAGRTIDDSFAMSASAPMSKDTGEATFAALDGTSNGVSIGLDWTRSSSRPFNFGDKLGDFCKRAGFSRIECDSNTIEDRLASQPDPTQSRLWQQLLQEFGWARVYGINAKVTHNRYKYYTSLTQTEQDREQQWEAGASFGITSPSRNTYIGLGMDFGRNYKEADPRIVCPLSTTDTFDCVQGRFAPPKRSYSRTANVEFRSIALGRPFSLRLEHDFASDESSADLPIYLFRDKATKFTGGLRLGWSDKDEFIAGIFVGKDFKVTPGN